MRLWAMRYYMSIVYIVFIFIFICRRKANPAFLRIIQILHQIGCNSSPKFTSICLRSTFSMNVNPFSLLQNIYFRDST